VEDLVPPVAEPPQSLRRRPDLGRIVIGELRGDDLVDGEVQPRVHLTTVDDQGLDLGVELGVRGGDQQRTVIRIGSIEQLRVDVVAIRQGGNGERQPPITVGLRALHVAEGLTRRRGQSSIPAY
jgi:hypothetical protein